MEKLQKINDHELTAKMTDKEIEDALKILGVLKETSMAYAMWQSFENSCKGLSECLDAIGVTGNHQGAWTSAEYVLTSWLSHEIPNPKDLVNFKFELRDIESTKK